MGLMSWAKRKMARVNLRALAEGRHHDPGEQATFDAIVAATVEHQPDDPEAIQDGIQNGFWRIFGPGPDVTFSPGELLDAAAAVKRRYLGASNDPDIQKREKFRELDWHYHVEEGAAIGDDSGREFADNAKATWLVSRGNDFGNRGMLDEALSDFEDALRLQPDHLAAHVSRALVYLSKGDSMRARQLVAAIPEEMRVAGTVVARKADMAEVLSRITG